MPAYGSTASYDGEYTVLDGQDCRAARWNATLLRGGYNVEVAYVPALAGGTEVSVSHMLPAGCCRSVSLWQFLGS